MTTQAPAFTVEMAYLPSKNDARKIGSSIAAASFNKEWREKSREAALTRAEVLGLPISLQSYIIKTRTPVLVATPKPTKTGKTRKAVAKKWGYLASTAYRAALTTPLLTKCSLILKVWRPDATVWDITNPWLGPVLDGFVDAGILAKDDCWHLIRYTVEMMGLDESLKLTPHEKAKAKAKKGLHLRRARYLFEFYDET